MNYHDNEKKLKRFFQSLRARDEQEAPPFSKVWRTAAARYREKKRLSVRAKPMLVVVSAAVIVIAVFLGRRAPEQGNLISQWRSPTSHLVKRSGPAQFRRDRFIIRKKPVTPWQSPTTFLAGK